MTRVVVSDRAGTTDLGHRPVEAAVGVTQSDVSERALDVSCNTEVVRANATGILVKINRRAEGQAGVR
ncbi:MAG: hypothetical protein F4103_02875, partial [Boseongicola sp. SB0673_bin_14]|nr:hypothetical protein [Boseongicola sp. SB0673_bin_14]